MSARKNEINLIPQDKFAASAFGRIITWLLSTFRVMVIFVEMTVMMAFLSRFWLDAKNADLTDEIKQKQAIIVASAELEKVNNSVADKLKIFEEATGNSQKASQTLEAIVSRLPADVTLGSINYSPEKASLTGTATGEGSISQFVANMNSGKQFAKISIGSLAVDAESGKINFSFDLTYGK